jgi:soluble lytic murein transglycosylase
LIAGRAAFGLGDYAAAAELFDTALESLEPEIVSLAGDTALFYAGESHFRAKDRATARERFSRLLNEYPASPWVTRATARRADCLLSLGDRAGAASAYRALREARKAEGKRSRALFLDESQISYEIARSLPSEDAQRRALLGVFLDFPATPAAEEARRLLSPVSLTGEQQAARISALFEARQYETACQEGETLSAEENAAEAAWWKGRCLVQSGERFSGGEQMVQGSESSAARRWQAIGVFTGASGDERSQGYTRARELIAALQEKYPESSEAKKARYKAAWLDYHEGKFSDAAAAFERYLKDDASDEDARWYAAWSHYLANEFKPALSHLETLGKSSGALLGGKGRYWRARILEQQGDKKGARALYQEIRAQWPLSYYASLSRLRLGEKAPAAKVETAPVVALAELLPEAKAAQFWLSLGMRDEARLALRAQEAELLKADEENALPLCTAYASLEGYTRAFELALSTQKEALAALPETPEDRAAWACAYPRAFRESTEKAGARWKVDPLFLYALMQKESAYDPWAVSYADAYGLLQLLPKTAAKLAEKNHEPTPRAEDLFDPERNISLAAFYLSLLQARFAGQYPLTAAAYNGGPGAVSRWLTESGARPFDEFVEQITYAQSREYLKKTFELYARYRFLYEGLSTPAPEKLDLREESGLVDF